MYSYSIRQDNVLVFRNTRGEGSAQQNIFGRMGSGGLVISPPIFGKF